MTPEEALMMCVPELNGTWSEPEVQKIVCEALEKQIKYGWHYCKEDNDYPKERGFYFCLTEHGNSNWDNTKYGIHEAKYLWGDGRYHFHTSCGKRCFHVVKWREIEP